MAILCDGCGNEVLLAHTEDGARITVDRGPGNLAVYVDWNGAAHVRDLSEAGAPSLRFDEFRGRPHNAACYSNRVRVA